MTNITLRLYDYMQSLVCYLQSFQTARDESGPGVTVHILIPQHIATQLTRWAC